MDRETLERKLRIRSWRRGTKEMDLLLGRFADARLAGLHDSELRAYEALLDRGDPDICDILFGLRSPGKLSPIIARIRTHHGIGDPPDAGPGAGGALQKGAGGDR